MERNKATYLLIAEDDDDDFYFFSSVVKELSYNVELTRVNDGEKLMHELKQKCPDILFLDILMPCMDGRLCIRSIRSDKKYDALPVIIYSSTFTHKEVEFFHREGASLYVIKPGSSKELKKILDAILSTDWKEFKVPEVTGFIVNLHSS